MTLIPPGVLASRCPVRRRCSHDSLSPRHHLYDFEGMRDLYAAGWASFFLSRSRAERLGVSEMRFRDGANDGHVLALWAQK